MPLPCLLLQQVERVKDRSQGGRLFSVVPTTTYLYLNLNLFVSLKYLRLVTERLQPSTFVGYKTLQETEVDSLYNPMYCTLGLFGRPCAECGRTTHSEFYLNEQRIEMMTVIYQKIPLIEWRILPLQVDDVMCQSVPFFYLIGMLKHIRKSDYSSFGPSSSSFFFSLQTYGRKIWYSMSIDRDKKNFEIAMLYCWV